MVSHNTPSLEHFLSFCYAVPLGYSKVSKYLIFELISLHLLPYLKIISNNTARSKKFQFIKRLVYEITVNNECCENILFAYYRKVCVLFKISE